MLSYAHYNQLPSPQDLLLMASEFELAVRSYADWRVYFKFTKRMAT